MSSSDEMLLVIQHGKNAFCPPVEDDVQLELERRGSPGKLTFTTVKVEDKLMNFVEGDSVKFYYKEKCVFVGYVFTKKRDKDQRIKVTCYDQLRYLKNKFTYVFEKKTASDIIKSLCKDFGMQTGTIEDTKYVIPAIAEENTSAFDIILKALDETLTNTGKMFVLYDDCGKITLRDSSTMKADILISEDTAQNFSYSSSIDDETYNSIVLWYSPEKNSSSSNAVGYATVNGSNTGSIGGSSGGSGGGTSADNSLPQAQRVLKIARGEVGVKENPMGSNNVKYNTEYYGHSVSGSAYPWCAVFVWWCFKHAGLSSLIPNTAGCDYLINWYKQRGLFHKTNPKPGDLIFYDWNRNGAPDHVGLVEGVSANGTITTIEGNVGNKVVKRTYMSQILGYATPNYSKSTKAIGENISSTVYGDGSGSVYQVFHAQSKDTIKQWGLLRYFEEVKTPSSAQQKANTLLKLYNRKTRELKIDDAFGETSIRGGTLIGCTLGLGDINVRNFMLVESVKHKFKTDEYTMDLTLDGAWEE